MISNKEIAAQFKDLAKIMEIYDENVFKIRSYQNAARTIEQLDQPLSEMQPEDVGSIKGIGSAIQKKIYDILETGELPLLEQYLDKTPEGVVEMLRLKGLGGKKIGIIWRELGVTSIGELQYACEENRLATLKGFGNKTQENVIKAIEFYQANQHKKLFATAEVLGLELLNAIRKVQGVKQAEFTGAMRRKKVTISEVEMLVATASGSSDELKNHPSLNWEKLDNKTGLAESPFGLNLKFYFCLEKEFPNKLYETSTPQKLAEQIEANLNENHGSEEEIFENAGFPFIIPEMREPELSLDYIKNCNTEELITTEDIKGLVHAHSTYSDGRAGLREMARACIERGFEYLAISDHSQSAFYANGLTPERVKKQHEEIEKLNEELKPFKIFKGIESDILMDGNLDYEDAVLESFDFIIASVHSQLKMDEEKATKRLLKAIENPYTSILGHMTGRLLLTRDGFPVNHQKIIDACAENNVSIEINANPHRLDLDWRHIPYAQEKGVLISINPDAHAISGIEDVKYGTFAARKGGLLKQNTLNAFSKDEFEKWIDNRRP